MTLWRTRLAGASAEALWDFTASLRFDVRLAATDLAGNFARIEGRLTVTK